MRLGEHVSATLDLPTASTALGGPGMTVSMLCALMFTLIGLANYAGYLRFIATAYIFSPFVILAMFWLGSGALVLQSGVTMLERDSAVWTVAGLAVALQGAVLWVVGVVGLFWLPTNLRPRWMREVFASRDSERGIDPQRIVL